MSILRNKYEIIDENESYTIPAVVRNDDDGISFKKAIALSTLLHPGTVGLAWVVIALLAILGIKIHLFKAPDFEKKQDIEFVLVDKPAPPKNPNTKNRAEMNSRTGGIRDKKKPVAMPTGDKSKSASSLQKMVKQQQKQIQQESKPHKQVTKRVETPVSPVTAPSTQTRPSPKPPAERPTTAPSSRPVSAPKVVAPRATTPFSVPVPSAAPSGNYLSTGPIGGTGAKTGAPSGGAAAGSGGTRNAPTPSLSTYKGGSGSSAASGDRTGGGYAGNPGGGGGRPGIDALKEPDFGPYMRDLQRRIKFNWNPPKGNESKRVVLLFKIAKNGQLLSCKVHKSSGLPAADQAALNAVKLTAPFRPLPAEYKGTSIDIQFTFDYNVFGASRY